MVGARVARDGLSKPTPLKFEHPHPIAMTRPSLIDRLTQAHAERAQAGLLRRLRTVTSAQGPHVVVAGRSLLGFASNDYLGLAADPRIASALREASLTWGVGAGAAHLLGGHRGPHQQLEEELADWLGYPRALLFSTGMMANLGVLSALLGRGDLCVQDRLNHASLIDGARLSGAELLRYPHADIDAAARQLAARADAAALLASDGVFSMDGDIAPLSELAALCKREHATLMVDDAHGLGVVGANGRGSVAAAGLSVAEVPFLVVTLGKAIGTFGAAVLGSEQGIEALLQFARTYIYTTAMPPALASAGLAAIRIARAEDDLRAVLHGHIDYFRQGAQQRGLALSASATPIQPLPVGDSTLAAGLAQSLEAQGFHVPAIRPPTVPEGSARLRITLSAAHTRDDIDALLDAILRAQASVGICADAPAASRA